MLIFKNHRNLNLNSLNKMFANELKVSDIQDVQKLNDYVKIAR